MPSESSEHAEEVQPTRKELRAALRAEMGMSRVGRVAGHLKNKFAKELKQRVRGSSRNSNFCGKSLIPVSLRPQLRDAGHDSDLTDEYKPAAVSGVKRKMAATSGDSGLDATGHNRGDHNSQASRHGLLWSPRDSPSRGTHALQFHTCMESNPERPSPYDHRLHLTAASSVCALYRLCYVQWPRSGELFSELCSNSLSIPIHSNPNPFQAMLAMYSMAETERTKAETSKYEKMNALAKVG